jgi:serine/threonine protein phosphatase PrpC
LRDGKLAQLTRDHSQVEELVQRGLLMPEQAESHPAANIITRAVGAANELFIDVDLVEAESGDTFLLCSDGLYKHLNTADLSALLAQENLRDITEDLINLTLERGASDNVTVVVARLADQVTPAHDTQSTS